MSVPHHKHFPYEKPFVFARSNPLPSATFIIRKNLNNYEKKFGSNEEGRQTIPTKQEYLSRQEYLRAEMLSNIFADCPYINQKPELKPHQFARQAIASDSLIQVQFARWNDDFHLGIIPSRNYCDKIDCITGQHFPEDDYIFWQQICLRHEAAAGGLKNIFDYICDLIDAFKEEDDPQLFIAAHGFDPRTLIDNASLFGNIQNCIVDFGMLPDQAAEKYAERYTEIYNHITASLQKLRERVYVVLDNNTQSFITLNDSSKKLD